MALDASSNQLDDDEFRTLVRLLHRFCETELDQWALWRLTTKYDEVFIRIRRSPAPGEEPADYDSLDRFLEPPMS